MVSWRWEIVSGSAENRTIELVNYLNDLSANDLSIIVSKVVIAVRDHVMCISVISDLNLDGNVDSLHCW